jgi:hypothetical protein
VSQRIGLFLISRCLFSLSQHVEGGERHENPIAGSLLCWKMPRMRPSEITGRARAFRAWVGAGSVAAFLFALTLAAAPGLHEHFHADAAQAHHECAVTVIGSGKFQLTGAALAVAAPAAVVQTATVAPLHPVWVPSLFLRACIYAHAPPARS